MHARSAISDDLMIKGMSIGTLSHNLHAPLPFLHTVQSKTRPQTLPKSDGLLSASLVPSHSYEARMDWDHAGIS